MSLTAIAFLLAFGGLLLWALVKDPRYGLYVYLATFYLSPTDRWWGADLPHWRWSLIAAAAALVAAFRVPRREDRPSWMGNAGVRALIVMTIWIWIQNFWALVPDLHLELSILYTKYVVLLYLIYTVIDSEESVRYFLIAHVLGCFYLGLLALQASGSGRLEGVGGPGIDEANALGMHLGTGAVAAAALLAKGPLWQRGMALASMALIMNGVVQTGSRGAFLAIVASGLVLFVMSPSKFRRMWVIMGILGIAVLLKMAPPNYWARMSTIKETAEEDAPVDQSSETRLALLKAQWQMFLAHPMGSGHRGTEYLSTRYLSDADLSASRDGSDGQRARSSHNTFMTALTEQGIPGAILYLWLLVWIWRTCRQTNSRFKESGNENLGLYAMAVGSSLAVVIVAGFFVDYFKAEVFIWCVALLAVLDSMHQHKAVPA